MSQTQNQITQTERSNADLVNEIEDMMCKVASKLPIPPAKLEKDDPNYSDWMILLKKMIQLAVLREELLDEDQVE